MAIGLKVLMNVKAELVELYDKKGNVVLKAEGGTERYKKILKEVYSTAARDIISTAENSMAPSDTLKITI